MREQVVAHLKGLEESANCRVVYACLGGSRAWGYATHESDYDVFFIYKRPANVYLGLSDPKDTIQARRDEFEITGWDLRKAAQLAGKSNPGLIEHLLADEEYIQQQPLMGEFTSLTMVMYDPVAAWWHYRSIAHNQWRKYLITKDYPLKKWWSFYRGVMMARYAERHDNFPPTHVEDLSAVLDLQGKLRHFVHYAAQGKLDNYDKSWLHAWSEGAYNRLMASEAPERQDNPGLVGHRQQMSDLVSGELLTWTG